MEFEYNNRLSSIYILHDIVSDGVKTLEATSYKLVTLSFLDIANEVTPTCNQKKTININIKSFTTNTIHYNITRRD